MADLLPVVSNRINYLRICRDAGMPSEVWGKLSDQTILNIINTITCYPGSIAVDTASSLVSCILDDQSLFNAQGRQAIVESINGKTRHVDTVSFDEQQAAATTVLAGRTKQSLYHVENYFTHPIWKALRHPCVSKESVYADIAHLLVKLGLHRPRETFWSHLVGFIRCVTEDPMDNPRADRDILKARWSEARLTMDLDFSAPTVYPKVPAMLMQTHPDIYRRAYVDDEPSLPPPTMDVQYLEVLKATTGCRKTKTLVFKDTTARMERHRVALETIGDRKAVSATSPR